MSFEACLGVKVVVGRQYEDIGIQWRYVASTSMRRSGTLCILDENLIVCSDRYAYSVFI